MAQFESQPSQSPPAYTSTLGGNHSTFNLCARCSNPVPPDPVPPNQVPPERPEDDLNQVLEGWPSVAKLIKENPGFEAFQSFKDLNIKMLLYYQGELHQLRMRLHKQEWKDSTHHSQLAGCEGEFLNESIEHLLESKYKTNIKARKQYDLVVEIRELLGKYSLSHLQF